MKKEVTAVLNLIKELEVESDVRLALGANRPQATSNGYPIYYDEASGEAAGIFYKNIVFLKNVSEKRLTWPEAVEYCKTIVINGVTAQLCPVSNEREGEFKKVCRDLKTALAEIGAKELDTATWCTEVDRDSAWKLCFDNGHLSSASKEYGHPSYVRPVLLLKR